MSSLFEEHRCSSRCAPDGAVAIDRVEERTVPVEVDTGEVPEGLAIDEPVVSAEEVTVRGPASVVGSVDRAVARVRIDASGIDVNLPVDSSRSTSRASRSAPASSTSIRRPSRSRSTCRRSRRRRPSRCAPTSSTAHAGSGLCARRRSRSSRRASPSSATPEELAEIVGIPTDQLTLDGASEDQVFEARAGASGRGRARRRRSGDRHRDGDDRAVGVEPHVRGRPGLRRRRRQRLPAEPRPADDHAQRARAARCRRSAPAT